MPFILCGDLNSSPDSGALHLLLQRKLLPHQCNTWKYLYFYTWDMPYTMEIVDNMKTKEVDANDHFPPPPTLELPSSFPSIILGSDPSSESSFTHYVSGFVGTLDYVVASCCSSEEFGFERVSSAPMPCKEDNILSPHVAMPNEGMPSDHVSLVCDLRWTCNNSTKTT